MEAKDRLAKIRSIIRRLEEEMDRMRPGDDQVMVLREAIVEIIMAAGPQESGCRRLRGESKRSK